MHVTDPSTISAAVLLFVFNVYNTVTGIRERQRARAQDRSQASDNTTHARVEADYARCDRERAELHIERDALKVAVDALDTELRDIRRETERRDGLLRRNGYESADEAFKASGEMQAEMQRLKAELRRLTEAQG